MSLINIENKQQSPYDGAYPSVFKKIDVSDVRVNSFQSYKKWTIISGSVTSSVLPLQGIYSEILPALETELTYNDASNIDGSLQTITYYSINHFFYKNKKEPLKTFGPTDLNKTSKFLYQTASIFSIPQNKVGDGIKAASFSFTSSVSGSYASDIYGNIYDVNIPTSSIITGVKFYEGFNEYFDISRIPYNNWANITFTPGVVTTTGRQLPIGMSAKFNGSGYIESTLDGYYNRNNDYSISFFITASNSGTTNQLILAKASSSADPVYPFKIELNSDDKILFTVGGSTTFTTFISSSTAMTGSWQHVLCQKTGSSIQLYVNGTLESQTSSSLLYDPMSPLTASARIDNAHPLKIGGYDTNSSNLTGFLDEVRIFNKSLNASQISSLKDLSEGGTALQTRNVGNVFTKQGIVVFSSPDYRVHDIINTPYTASYRSTLTIHEMSVLTKIDAGDFNMSTNVSLTQDNDTTYYPFVSSSDFAPYITTIGLYDNFGQLLAIGKLAQPIKKRSDVDMNFLIRLDLDNNVVFKG
jgi:hypothetical protein